MARQCKAAHQFESTLDLLRAGAFEGIGIPRDVREMHPVACVFEQPVSPLTYRAIVQDDLEGHELVKRAARRDVAPPHFLDIEEVELWAMAAERGRRVCDLL